MLLLTLDVFAEWAYWNLFQRSFLISLYAFPVYLSVGVLFLIAALIRKLRKESAAYYWWLGVVIVAIPLVVAVWLLSA